MCSEHLLLPGRLQNFFFPMDLGHLRGVLHQIFVAFLVPMEKMFQDDSQISANVYSLCCPDTLPLVAYLSLFEQDE